MMIKLLSIVCLAFLSGCHGFLKHEPKLKLIPVSIEDIPDWYEDDHRLAFLAFKKSCLALEKKSPGKNLKLGTKSEDWHKVCYAAARVDPADKKETRIFFEQNFQVFKATDKGQSDGLFTGYYESSLKGSKIKTEKYHYPLHKRPKDLVSVPDIKYGRKSMFGYKPHYSRSEIHQGKLNNQGLEIVYVDSEADAFFLHVQGSGRVVFEDGSTMRVGYDGANGHPYTSVGKILIDRGEVPKEYMSMQAIRHWLKCNTETARNLMEENQSYVFFKVLEGDGPLGSQGVAVSTGRSLAIDKRFYEMGMPMYLDAAVEGNQVNLRRLLIAQDTGGAIKGAVRGDVFWGYGDKAAEIAGTMKSTGQLYIFIPKDSQIPRHYLL
jgi:membrane-bound lytic murein transglycosylase A